MASRIVYLFVCFSTNLAVLAVYQPLFAQTRTGVTNRVNEWSFESGKTYDDPFHDIELDVVFKDPEGNQQRVPAFWAGEQTWRVRYSTPNPGIYTWQTAATDTANPDLHGRTGTLRVSPYRGNNPLYKHGPLKISQNRRYFEHADGTPFFWMGDTWWHCLNKDLRWPEDFQLIVADRVEKGFNVVQIVAGLAPNVPPNNHLKCENEGGLPWEGNYQRINPAYFDMADLRIQYLAENGIMPCVVACWGYYLPAIGEEKMKQHWRNLVARWGAYPVVWCLAGEGTLPYARKQSESGDYSVTKTKQERQKDKDFQRTGWTRMAHYLHGVDPFDRLVSIHPSTSSRVTVDDPSVVDFDMLQTGHNDRQSIPNTLQKVVESYETTPTMPVINSEVCYEGIFESSRHDLQRIMFWSCILNGACGHTYGANGLWQVNLKDTIDSWGSTPWYDAYRYLGSREVGLGANLLRRYPWWRFEPHPEWVTYDGQPPQLVHQGELQKYLRPYAAGIPGKVRVIYVTRLNKPPTIKKLDPDASYQALRFNPLTGDQHDLGMIKPTKSGDWEVPKPPVRHDWVIVLEKS